MTRVMMAVVVASLCGCAAVGDVVREIDTQGRYPLLSDRTNTEALMQAETSALCFNYARLGRSMTGTVKAELIRRNALTADEWVLVDEKKIRVGMSEHALNCSFGYAPSNESVGSWGSRKQYIYHDGGGMLYRGTMYVYTENGKVTSWQK